MGSWKNKKKEVKGKLKILDVLEEGGGLGEIGRRESIVETKTGRSALQRGNILEAKELRWIGLKKWIEGGLV